MCLFCLLFKHKKLFLKFSWFWSHCFWICRSFRTLSNFGKLLIRFSEDFLENLLMYFMLEEKSSRKFSEVFCLKWYKWMISSGVQTYLCWGMIYSSMCNSFVYCLFYDLCVYYFSCELFCKLEEMLMKRIW